MPITRRVKTINKHKFMKIALDEASKIFVVYIATIEVPISIMISHSTRKLLLAAVKLGKLLTEVAIK